MLMLRDRRCPVRPGFTGRLRCSATQDRAVAIVREGQALLRHPESGDPDWEADRQIFLEDAQKLLADIANPSSKGS
jgi:hypothetical protein